MKSAIMIIMGLFLSISLNAQWTGTTDINNTNTGNVGIGTTTPASKLHVVGDVRTTQKYVITNIGSLDQASGDLFLSANQNLQFGSAGSSTQKLTLTTTGNVGIGTTTPSSKLEVVGDVRTSQKYVITSVGALDQQSSDIFLPANNNLKFASGGSSTAALILLSNGNVGIGATTIDTKLTVAGTIKSREVNVSATAGADYVFDSDYELKGLDEVEKYIKENGHLPNVASGEEMVTNGIELGKMDMKLLEKIEELTLYVIELRKEIESLKQK